MSDEVQSAIAARILEEIKQQERNAILSQPLALNKLLQEKREDILRIAKGYGASNIRVFGSVARGESDAKSDIDLLLISA
jgi:predicted nucleotidyltransferase